MLDPLTDNYNDKQITDFTSSSYTFMVMVVLVCSLESWYPW